MTQTALNLLETTFAPTSETSVYVSTGVRTIIDKFTATNVTGTAATLVVKIVPSGGTAGAVNAITPVAAPMSIAANSTYLGPEVVGQILNPGDFISVIGGTASALVLRISGRQLT